MTAAEALDPDESLWHALAFQLRHERQKRGLPQAATGDIMGVNKRADPDHEAGRNGDPTSRPSASTSPGTPAASSPASAASPGRLRPDWGRKVHHHQREADQQKRTKLQEAMLERRPKAPLIWPVLDEIALRPLASPEVMRAQHATISPHAR